jgi:hypothetical protein
MLDCIEDVGEAPCRLRGSYRDHEYTLDLFMHTRVSAGLR